MRKAPFITLPPAQTLDQYPLRVILIFTMPQSLARVVLHLIFSTKNRSPDLKDATHRADLYAYVAGILKNEDCDPIIIGGVEDHIHILCNLSRTMTIADLILVIKKRSSMWMKEQGEGFKNFYWQAGYAAFSVSQSNVESVREYIRTQEEHHRKITFQDEFRLICQKHGLQIDERYVWE